MFSIHHIYLGMKAIRLNNKIESSFNLFQIDDGYQNAWGDWTLINNKKFPSQSLYPLVQRIKDAKMIPGLWFAPFSCDKFSNLAKLHPHWILKK
jgi:alpha-galactosidase